MIDIHAHLTVGFEHDMEEVLDRARSSGVEMIFVTGEDYENNLKVLSLVKRYSFLKACPGHHPGKLDMSMAEENEELIRMHRERIVGIGEVGLDFGRARSAEERSLQSEIFRRFISLSLELSLPLVIHSHCAEAEAVEILAACAAEKVCLHDFEGDIRVARRALDLGYYFSVPPSVVWSARKQALAAELPLERLLLETDSPVLGPEENERNEPSNLIHAARRIAGLKGVPLDKVQWITRENTFDLFSLSSRERKW